MFGDILRRSVSLIMLPIYTRYLTPEDYGVVELLSMLLDFASIIFGARIGQAVFRFYCTASSENEKKDIIASALLLSIVLSGIGTIVIVSLSEPLAVAIFSDSNFQNFITLFAITLFLEPFMEIPLVHIRAQQKPWLFFIFSSTKLIIQLSLNIYLVVMLEMHVEGVIYSAVISGIIIAIALTGYSVAITGLKVSKITCKKLFTFSLPLKLATLGSFYMTFGDRYILNIFTDLSQVGIYALGYKFGFIFLILTWDPFQKMWDAEKYTVYKKPNAKFIYQKVFIYTSSILIFVGLCISIFTKDLLQIMADTAFLSAYEIVPIIIVAYIFQAWTRFCNFGILISHKTMHIAYAELLGVIGITIAYFTLIPKYGMHGAAWSTVIGFAIRFYWTNRKSAQFYNMELPWFKVSLIFTLAILFYTLSLFVPNDIVESILWRIVIIIIFCTVFFLLPILTENQKKEVWEKTRTGSKNLILNIKKWRY